MTWALVWSFGGDSGTADDIDVRWSESISLVRQTGNWRSASIDVLLPIDMRTARAHPRTGYASLTWDGVQVIAGPWRSPSYQMTSDGRTRFSIELSDNDADDRGSWPPVSQKFPRRNPREISSYSLTAVQGARDWGGRVPDRLVTRAILSKDEFPDIAEPAEGSTWPYPIGRPGRGQSVPAVPAYVYDTRTEGGNTRKLGLSGVPIGCETVTIYGPIRDVWSVSVDVAHNVHAYTINLLAGGSSAYAITYVSDGSATIDEIVQGLADAWNADSAVTGTATAVADLGANVVWITGVTPGQQFTVTESDADLSVTHDTKASMVAPASGIAVHTAARDDGTSFAYVEMADFFGVIDNEPSSTFYWSVDAADATPAGAGDVMLSILAASSMPIDFLEWERIAYRLNRYLIDGYCDAPTTPMEFARAQILPLLPVSVVPGPSGLRPVLWPWLDDTDARGISIIDGIGISVSDRVAYLESPSLQSMSVRFGYRPDTGKAILWTAADADSTVYASLSIDAADADSIEARFLWDRATAQKVATDALRWLSWSPRVLEIQVTDRARYGPQGTDDLYPGRRVLVTVSALGLSAVAAVIGEREWDADATLVRAYLLDDPLTAV